MNFFMKIMDDLRPEAVSGYTAWYLQRLMMLYSESEISNMWRVVEE